MSKKKDEIVISDRLLSWIFGCECEFKEVESTWIHFTCSDDSFLLSIDKGIFYCEEWQDNYININQFIHLAKIKAFECGYNIVEYSNSVKILGKKKFYHKVNYNRFTVELTIEALEWVAEEVGGNK